MTARSCLNCVYHLDQPQWQCMLFGWDIDEPEYEAELCEGFES